MARSGFQHDVLVECVWCFDTRSASLLYLTAEGLMCRTCAVDVEEVEQPPGFWTEGIC